jgi:hypothetical protein
MHIFIHTGSHEAIAFPINGDTDAILKALPHARHVARDYSSNAIWKDASEKPPEISLVADAKFQEVPEPIRVLTAENERRSQDWYREYSAHEKTKQALKAANDRIAEITNVVTPEPAT